jgi:peptidyl-prolyl cis-trans isomerase SurA
MKRKELAILIPLCGALLAALPAVAEEIDRLIAAVNGRVIVEGDLNLARNLNALYLFGQSRVPLSRGQETDRLIELELLRQELENFPIAPADQTTIEARLAELRSGYAEVGGLEAMLRRVGLQYPELVDYVRLQASIWRFVDLRFRPFVSVSADEIKAYYGDTLVPKLRQGGATVPPLPEVSSRIEEILREQKVNSALDQWIQDVRRHSRIEYFAEESAPEQSR